MSSEISHVTVPSAVDLESAVLGYLAQGFVIGNRTATSVTMQKQKQFSVLWAVVGLVLCVLPLLIYLVVYAVQPDVRVVEIRVAP